MNLGSVTSSQHEHLDVLENYVSEIMQWRDSMNDKEV